MVIAVNSYALRTHAVGGQRAKAVQNLAAPAQHQAGQVEGLVRQGGYTVFENVENVRGIAQKAGQQTMQVGRSERFRRERAVAGGRSQRQMQFRRAPAEEPGSP